MDFSEQLEKYSALVYRYLGVRNRSEKEIRDYLAKKHASEDIIDRIISKLYSFNYLNDEAFARGWVRSRAHSRPKGKIALHYELRQKGISDELDPKSVK